MLVVCRNPECRVLIGDDRDDRRRILGDDVDDLFFVCPECLSLARVAARMSDAEPGGSAAVLSRAGRAAPR